jgi:CBS domain-containing protein
MRDSVAPEVSARLVLWAETAADLMTPNPVSIEADATVREAVTLLSEKGFSAAPVIDEAGRPVGVLSQSDIVVHDREKVEYVPSDGDPGQRRREVHRRGFEVENVDHTRVRDIMTPVVFAVPPDLPAHRVIDDLLAHRVHRLFVVDGKGVLVGVISTVDVLRHFRREACVGV